MGLNIRQKWRSIKVDDKDIDFIIDSGATTSIIDSNTFSRIFAGNVKLEQAPIKIFTYGSSEPLPLKGLFYPTFVYQGRRTVGALVVTKVSEAGCLLSETMSTQLGIIKMDDQMVNAISCPAKGIIDRYPELCRGIGKLKEYQMKLDIDQTVKPTVQACRTIPYHLLKTVDEEIEKLLAADIIEPVSSPTTWCSPLQVVTQKSGEPRLCVDLRQANKAVQRVHFPIPTLEDVTDKVAGSVLFSKIDLKKGYHQIELHPDSRDITTFRYPGGIYRYKRLVFGLSSAFELFQQKINELFVNQTGIINISDDILVFGRTQQEHDENLETCLSILSDRGLTINRAKCVFRVSELEYYGFIISGNGMRATESKVISIKATPNPKNPKEVRSFLGLVNYLGRFIPDLSTISAPLRALTTKGYSWRWTRVEEECFNKLKNIVSSQDMMCHFKTGLPIKLVVDASPVGLGAILLQDHGQGQFRPICYASRSLSKVEQRYCQTEREALAVLWACERFHLFVYGKHFQVETDHKPLIGIFSPNGNKSARISSWAIKLLQYDFELIYLPGQTNPADVLSRASVEEEGNQRWTSGYELEVEQHLNQVIAYSIPRSMTLSQIRSEGAKDQEFQNLISAITSNNWHQYPELNAFKTVSKELSHKGGVVLKGNQLVVPKGLRATVLSIAHANHLGINKTKSLLRTKVWWPSIGSDVEKLIRDCVSCTLVQPPNKAEPLTMTEMPPCWSKLHVDLCGPFPDGFSIIGIVDAGSRWPEVLIVRSTKTSVIVDHLSKLFINKGRPVEIVSDNGPQFISSEFRDFCKSWNVHHHLVTPEYPQANSEIERFFKTILKTIRIAVSEGKDWKKELQQFLLTYRNTPHSTTGKSPAELMYGRQLRDNLPAIEGAPTAAYKEAMATDAKNKATIKRYADMNQHLKPSAVKEGDRVVVKQKKINKFSTNFSKTPYTVMKRNKATLTLSKDNGKLYKRHTSATKVIPSSGNMSSQYLSDSSIDFEDFDGIESVQPRNTLAEVVAPVSPGREPSPEPPRNPPVATPPPPIIQQPLALDLDSEAEDEEHLPQGSRSSPVSTFVRRSYRKNAGGGVLKYGDY